ncbi:hypothetical protein EHS25_003998 [Saitozyma podzolica]|uniref:Fe2OG dioxygenase domain-containing protein n=1 Tax=Saitozyma podzolica TaxID=1890683 RepID=A0A427YT86_9TREE|nr:hypothetical protein EHS25_003998 [Saitozyma podzolica]
MVQSSPPEATTTAKEPDSTMAITQPIELTDNGRDLQTQYRDRGVVHVPQVIPFEEVVHIREVFTNQVEKDTSMGHNDNVAADDILARYPRFVHPHRHPDTAAGAIARHLMTDQRVLSIVNQLIGPANAAQSMFYFKPPTARGQALHQDNVFLQADPETCIAVWIAMDETDGDNGGLLVIPGSHTEPLICHVDADPTESFSAKTIPLPPGMKERAVQTRMRPGDALFFHGSLVHGSKGNVSDRFRRSLIFHYVPETSKEMAKFYMPLLNSNGEEVWIKASPGGGPCGEGFASEGH